MWNRHPAGGLIGLVDDLSKLRRGSVGVPARLIAFLLLCEPAGVEGPGEIRIQSDCLIEILDGAVVLALDLVGEAAAVEGIGVIGFEPDGL